MEVVKKRLDEICPNEHNVRKHTDKQIKEFVKSIDKYGVIRPIIIDENGIILAGHGLYETLKVMGKDDADVIVMAGLSEKDKIKLMLADNKIYELGLADYEVMDELLSQLGAEADFEIPGYDADMLEDLYGLKAVEAEAEVVKKIPADLESDAIEVKAAISRIDAVPSRHVEEQRQEAMSKKRIIMCPHCGEAIEL